MTYISVGDLAQTFVQRNQNSRLKLEMQRLSQELASGQTSNLAKTVAGDFTAIAGIEASLKSLSAYDTASNEAALLASGMQTALERVQGLVTESAPALVSARSASHATLVDSAAADAREKLDAVLSALNTQLGGRSLFAGVATDGPAIVDSDTLMAELQTLTAAETSAADILTALDTWFDTPGGGFETFAYLGSDTPLAPFQIGDGQATELAVTATDPGIRDAIKAFAAAALVTEGALTGDVAEQSTLLGAAGERLLEAETGLSGVRARVGAVEARIEAVITSNAAQTTALELARLEIVAVDPYSAASELEQVQTQLQTLYTITARMSGLSLVDYI